MNAKHLLRFMKKKLKTYGSDVVDTTNGKARTLLNVFEDMGVSWKDMSIDRLQVWADKSCLHRFDRFNNKYSPLGMNDLRTIFLKTDNPMGGRYLAELTRELIDDLEDSKYQHVEWRLSIYGRKRNEWDILSNWVLGADGKGLGGNKELLSPNLRWMIQIPRLFGLYKSTGQLNNFGEMLENIFAPMFEATINPEAHPQKAKFLANISGFDTVDDESKSQSPIDRTFSSKARTPGEWDLVDNPSYKYYSYFIQTNIRLLNNLRQLKGLNTFAYRPHAGEAGEVHHLDTAFLLADGINHGLNLRKAPSLQYLFYLAQIGLAMSPCSNNQLFLAYEKSPFPVYFARGLNVSLSTDDPLMFHQTREPLMEEYSIAKQLWHFTAVDLCEMARNSVLQSGFPDETKAAWLGCSNFAEDNVPSLSNVPALRVRFRRQVLSEELLMLSGKVSNSEDVGGICSVLLMSPTSRRKRLEGDALEDAFMPSGTTSMTLPRVAALPGEATYGDAFKGKGIKPVPLLEPLTTDKITQLLRGVARFAPEQPSLSMASPGQVADGSVVTWGDADHGGNSSAVAPLLAEGVVQVCGNGEAFAAIKADGSVVTWGDADHGVVQVCGTSFAFTAIKANSSVVTWGGAYSGSNYSAIAPLLTEGVDQVSGTIGAFAAIKADGSVVTWGRANSGGNSSAVAALLTEGVVQVCGNECSFAAIKADGSVVTWCDACSGGNSSAVAPLLTEGVVQVCGNGTAYAAIKADGSVVTWGDADHGGDSSAVAPLLTEGVIQVCGTTKAFVAKADGSVVTWGRANSGGNSSAVAALLTEGVDQVSGTIGAFAAIKADGSVVTWGDADHGGNSSAIAPLLTEVQVC
ncbi:unnamed protein product [Polarella glacialis]|uniref:AMP deaminase n=1 Tax=Polarella glacialis TaxID=89957 RepID=A0A813FLG2_POLGL|nr:unnamed protein product [Polarella glacialis]